MAKQVKQYALAKLLEYSNNGTRRASEVIGVDYRVGTINGCWFVSGHTPRRRIGTKGCTILKILTTKEVAEYNYMVREEAQLYSLLANVKQILNIKPYALDSLVNNERVGDIIQQMVDIYALLEQRKKDIEREHIPVKEYLLQLERESKVKEDNNE